MTDSESSNRTAIDALLSGRVQGVGFRQATLREARALGVVGWVRNREDATVQVHAEGDRGSVERLVEFLSRGTRTARVQELQVQQGRVEGHEQFAVRGVSAGAFIIQEHQATGHHFDLRLQVQGVMRSWALPKGPSLDPSVKRLAVQVDDHSLEQAEAEGTEESGTAIVWDRGTYEQSGRVPWPQALRRGHAVFVLHGSKLRGGFALQRTRDGSRAWWLLIKRRDEHARPGSDILVQRPESVISGRTLEQIIDST